MNEAQMIAVLVAAIGGLLLIVWGIIKSFGDRIMNKLDTVEQKVDDHNASTITRMTRVETKMDNIEERVEHIERIVLKRA